MIDVSWQTPAEAEPDDTTRVVPDAPFVITGLEDARFLRGMLQQDQQLPEGSVLSAEEARKRLGLSPAGVSDIRARVDEAVERPLPNVAKMGELMRAVQAGEQSVNAALRGLGLAEVLEVSLVNSQARPDGPTFISEPLTFTARLSPEGVKVVSSDRYKAAFSFGDVPHSLFDGMPVNPIEEGSPIPCVYKHSPRQDPDVFYEFEGTSLLHLVQDLQDTLRGWAQAEPLGTARNLQLRTLVRHLAAAEAEMNADEVAGGA